MDDFSKAEWTTKLFGSDVKERYVELKKGSADRCAAPAGNLRESPGVQFHHEVYNQYLWNQF